jgi:thiamine-monophosphate kinase
MSEKMLIQQLEGLFSQNYLNQKIDLSDDCAFLQEYGLIVTTDQLCEGVHFDLHWDRYEQIGRQCAIVNLSDLAASGALPLYLFWSIALTPRQSEKEILALAQGFLAEANRYQCLILGGNITYRKHKKAGLEISVTAIGKAKQSVTRSGAKEGDLIYVSGTLGDRALGYLFPSQKTRALRHQWTAHIEQSQALVNWGKVSAMMDISDGLLLDAARLAQASQVRLDLLSTQLPLSKDYLRFFKKRNKAKVQKSLKFQKKLKKNQLYGSINEIEPALSGGEDYLLLFTAPPTEKPPIPAYCIGVCAKGLGICLDGQAIIGRGFDHLS